MIMKLILALTSIVLFATASQKPEFTSYADVSDKDRSLDLMISRTSVLAIDDRKLETTDIASYYIELLKGNRVAYTTLLVGMTVELSQMGEVLKDMVISMDTKTVKVSKTQMKKYRKQLRKLRIELDRLAHFQAYLRALETCMHQVPVYNETTGTQSIGIQSRWCQDMKKTDEAKKVAQIVVWYGLVKGVSLDEAQSSEEAVKGAIDSLVRTGYIKKR